jgi:adenosine deaminase
MARADDFERAVLGVAESFAASGIAYAEVTFTPMTHVRRGVDPDAMLDGLASGRALARERWGVEFAWVFDIVRSFPDQADETLALALHGREQGVVALGIGGPEGPEYPTHVFGDVFARARTEGLRAVPHAGEQWGAQSIWEAIEVLHADRIGHGVRAVEDPKLVATLVERGVPLELCPSSNLRLGVVSRIEDHPIAELARAGVPLSLATDDPALFQCDLVGEYLLMHEVFGWDSRLLFELACAAVEHSFLPEASKRDLRDRQSAFRPV